MLVVIYRRASKVIFYRKSLKVLFIEDRPKISYWEDSLFDILKEDPFLNKRPLIGLT